MSPLIVLSLLIFLNCWRAEAEQPRWQACLAQDLKLSDVVSVERDKHGVAVKKQTVNDQLKNLGARCRNGKLIDKRGKQIYFYRLTGCWGNAPSNYLEILEEQRKKLRELRKHYTVVEMTCDLSDAPTP